MFRVSKRTFHFCDKFKFKILFPSATLDGNRDLLSIVAPEIFDTWLGDDENKLGLNRVKLRKW